MVSLLQKTSVAALPLPYHQVRYFLFMEVHSMETRVAVMSIIVENSEMVETLNAILHEYGEYIIGRMGLPYRKRKVNIIAIALDAPQNTISALSGKVGSLKGISVKTAYSGVISAE
jgi:putative iron-only hydrogenase system regulator